MDIREVIKSLVPGCLILVLYFSGYSRTLIEIPLLLCLKILLYPPLLLILCLVAGFLLVLHYISVSARERYGQSMKYFVQFYFDRVQPATIVEVFHKYDAQVLTNGEIEDIKSVVKHKSEDCGRKRLLELLCGYEGWFPCLLKVLRDPSVGQLSLADDMEAAFLNRATDEEREVINTLAASCKDVHDIEFSFDPQSELPGKRSACQRSSDHNLFIARKDFKLQVLPEKWRDVPMLNLVKVTASLTVRVVSNYVSDRRPWYSPLYKLLGHCGRYSPLFKLLGHREWYSALHKLRGHCGLKRFGSGMVWKCTKEYGLPDDNTISCSCRECQSGSIRRPWAEFTVVTAASLIYDDDECYFSTFTLDYDSDNVTETCHLTGVRLASSDDEGDVRKMTCVTHDKNLSKKLVTQLAQRDRHIKEVEYKGRWSAVAGDSDDMMSIIISHPHGLSKCVSVGEIIEPAEPSKPFVYKTKTCPGSCGAPVLVLGKLSNERGGVVYVTTSTHIQQRKNSGFGVSSPWE